MPSRFTIFLVSLLALGFTVWALSFITGTAIYGADGQWYHALYDDGMISMRYAWNFAHGHGLVWNPGEYVEGYSNLLMVLVMSLPTLLFDKSTAVLVVQLFGVALALGNAGLLWMIAAHIGQDYDKARRELFKGLAFACGLGYLPLIYWPLVGGDLGLQVFWMLLGALGAFKYVATRERRWLMTLVIGLGLCYLTRDDGLLAGVVIMAYVIVATRASRESIYAAGGLLLFPVLHTLFRLAYYGALVPNTYTLKVAGMPLADRLHDGVAYLLPFLRDCGWLLAAVTLSLPLRFDRRKLMAVGITAAVVSYQIWVGGDMALDYWRIVAGVMPLMLLFFVGELLRLVWRVTRIIRLTKPVVRGGIVMALLALALAAINQHYLSIDLYWAAPYNKVYHTYLVDRAVGVNQLTTPDATIGVLSAGVIPYYTGRYAIDFLGKNDRTIANLEPRLGTYSEGDMINLPGHVKYDLYYSIFVRQPVYVERMAWGADDVTQAAEPFYATVYLPNGTALYLLRDALSVRWETITP